MAVPMQILRSITAFRYSLRKRKPLTKAVASGRFRPLTSRKPIEIKIDT